MRLQQLLKQEERAIITAEAMEFKVVGLESLNFERQQISASIQT